MPDPAVSRLEATCRDFERALSAYEHAEMRVAGEQERYLRIGQEYMMSGPHRADHDLFELQRASRDAAVKDRGVMAAEHARAFQDLLGAALSLTRRSIAQAGEYWAIHEKAVAVRRGRLWLRAANVAAITSVLPVGWLAVTSSVLRTAVAGLVFLSILVVRSYLKLTLGTRCEALKDEVIRREGTAEEHGAPRCNREGQPPLASWSETEGPSDCGAGVIESDRYRQFDDMFRASLELKDRALLASALRLRREATELVRDVPALYCVGKHHEMILEYNHIGWGVEARQAAIESLSHEDEFRRISALLFPMFRTSFYQETLEFLSCASTSYEEAQHFFGKLKEEFPTEVSLRRYQEFAGLRNQYGRWLSAQRVILSSFYSRANQESDQGRYAGGLAVLDVVLTNADAAGYNLDYEEFVDLLDDMCALAMQLLMQKADVFRPIRSASEGAAELGCLLTRPIAHLTKFYPDCLPKDRELFCLHYRSFSSVPGIAEVPGWEELTSLVC